MDEQKILSNLRRHNPWWSSGEGPNLGDDFYKRSHYHFLKEQIHEEEITGILGPRRVGKTTILKQVVEDLLDDKEISPERVMFVQLDNPYLKGSLDDPIEDILSVYESYVLEESLEDLEEPVFIFLDEIQVISEWAKRLKTWYDLDYEIRFAITGSSSAKITSGSESLLGRIIDRKMLPLKFSETLRMKSEISDFELEMEISDNKHIMKNSFRGAVKEGNPEAMNKAFVKNESFLGKDRPKIKSELQKYIERGGFPKIIKKEVEEGLNPNYASTKLENDAEKAVRRDASEMFNVDPNKLMSVMVFISENTAQKLVESSLADFIDVSPNTAGKYVDYLEEAYLIHRTKFYSRNSSTSEKKKQKSYVWDPGFRNAISGSLGGDYTIDPGEKGLIAESICADHCNRLCYSITKSEGKTYYWDYQDGEVDLVLEMFDKALPIEVKYRNQISKKDLNGINRFIYDHSETDFGIVVTKDDTGILELREGKVVQIPLHNFLLMI